MQTSDEIEKRNSRPRSAGDLMATPAITLSSDSTVADVAELMVNRSGGSVIMIDDQGKYEGIITETAFLPHQSVYPFLRGMVSELMGVVIGTEGNTGYDEAIGQIKSTACSRVIDTSIPTVGPEARIDEVADLMATSGSHHIPVLIDGKPIGMVARHDMLRLFFK